MCQLDEETVNQTHSDIHILHLVYKFICITDATSNTQSVQDATQISDAYDTLTARPQSLHGLLQNKIRPRFECSSSETSRRLNTKLATTKEFAIRDRVKYRSQTV